MQKFFAGLMTVILIMPAFSYVSRSQAAETAGTIPEYNTESIRDLEAASRLGEIASPE